MRNMWRTGTLSSARGLALLCIGCAFGLSALTIEADASDRPASLSQRSSDFSATQKRARRNAGPAPVVVAPRPHWGVADPSFGPDGKPYRVPEYLRNQCYIDEGYGRFTACSYFN